MWLRSQACLICSIRSWGRSLPRPHSPFLWRVWITLDSHLSDGTTILHGHRIRIAAIGGALVLVVLLPLLPFDILIQLKMQVLDALGRRILLGFIDWFHLFLVVFTPTTLMVRGTVPTLMREELNERNNHSCPSLHNTSRQMSRSPTKNEFENSIASKLTQEPNLRE